MKASKLLSAFIMAAAIAAACAVPTISAFAQTAEGMADGTYSVSVSNDMPMGGGNLSSDGILEAENGRYYLSLTFNTAKMADPYLEIEGKKVGYMVTKEEGDLVTFCYTLSWEHLNGELPFTAYIVPMQSERELAVTVDLSSAERILDTVEERGERPAQFVPVIKTTAGGEYVAAVGSPFVLPSASATLGDSQCTVQTSVWFGEEQVPLSGNVFTAEKEGEYTAIYTASSPLYKTSSGADTYAEYVIKITARQGAGDIASFEDSGGVLPDGAFLQAGRVTDGAMYDNISKLMRTIADNFEVYDIGIYDSRGNAADISGNFTLRLAVNEEYDTSKLEVYLLVGNKLGKLDCVYADGYAVFTTNRVGTFIVCERGVAFVMPMWGYAVILVACVLVIAAAVTVTVILVKRKKKHRAENGGA